MRYNVDAVILFSLITNGLYQELAGHQRCFITDNNYEQTKSHFYGCDTLLETHEFSLCMIIGYSIKLHVMPH